MPFEPDAWQPPNEGPPPPPPPALEPRIDAHDARAFVARYRSELAKAGLPPTTRLHEFMQTLRAQGAMSMLSYINRNDPSKLSYDPDAVLIDELAERLRLGDEVIRKRSLA